jgi:hypothetical protein
MMEVDHQVYYLIYDPNGEKWRNQDHRANKIIKCVKNETFNGYFTVNVDGKPKDFRFAQRSEFLEKLWPVIAKEILAKLDGNAATLVPIPNSGATISSQEEYKTLQYAKAIAGHSGGRLVATDALRWKEAKDQQHKQGGRRTAEARYANMAMIGVPDTPIILFDDFLTSGSSLIAAHWLLDEQGIAPKRAVVIGRRTDTQHEDMTEWGTEELEIPHRGFF